MSKSRLGEGKRNPTPTSDQLSSDQLPVVLKFILLQLELRWESLFLHHELRYKWLDIQNKQIE